MATVAAAFACFLADLALADLVEFFLARPAWATTTWTLRVLGLRDCVDCMRGPQTARPANALGARPDCRARGNQTISNAPNDETLKRRHTPDDVETARPVEHISERVERVEAASAQDCWERNRDGILHTQSPTVASLRLPFSLLPSPALSRHCGGPGGRLRRGQA